MDQMDQAGSSDEGNTKSRRTPLGQYWQGTLNNYLDHEVSSIIKICEDSKFTYLWCKEEAPTTGTRHMHIFVQSTKRFRADEKFKNKKIHWERCEGDEQSNINYIAKKGKFEGNLKHKVLDIIQEHQLYDWQREIIGIISNRPDSRTIHWYWEKDGCAGKTSFCKYLSFHYKAVPLEGKKNDILFCAAQFNSEIYVWDIERSMETYISYGAIEKIKNGYYMCSKYESKPIIRNSPHVIIFANFPPKKDELSSDRWHIVDIGKKADETLWAEE